MIDGYVPEHSQLKKVNFQSFVKQGRMKEKIFWEISDIYSSKLPESRVIGIFIEVISTFLHNFRSSIEEYRHGHHISKRHYHPWPIYAGFTIGKRRTSIEGKMKSREYRDWLPLLTPEYRADEEKGKSRYIQNIVMCFPYCGLRDHIRYMKELEKYFIDSLKELCFKIKHPREYKNLEAFRKGWEGILVKRLKKYYSDGFLF